MNRKILLLVSFFATVLFLGCFAGADEAVIGGQADVDAALKSSAESHTFQAEVHQLMDIIINSLYSSREVFLRELISNASDALDKIRFKSLTDAKALGEKKDLDIRIRAEDGVLSIRDTGVGMTKDELKTNLGTIAKSGTKAFLQAAQAGDDSNLIGQFGVGFYSAFLVADRVRVVSKSNDDPVQWVWESDAEGEFSIVEDPRGNTLGRGTEVQLFLKEDALEEFEEEENLDELIRRFSEFINFPIYLWQEEEIERTVSRPKDPEAPSDDDGVSIEDADDEETEELTYLEVVHDWQLINDVKPIWTRDPEDISDEEYNSFYRSISSDYRDPAARIHFKAEGDVNFRSILFAPSMAPANVFDGSYQKTQRPLKLYVKRVFITDDFQEMMPKYLSFLHGIVDSDDINLNVSREMLQQSKTLAVIKKKLVRKAIAMFQQLAEDDPEAYSAFFEQFGTHIKWGMIEDPQNKGRLEKLLRFYSNTEKALTSLDDYIERMADGQDQIFYLSGADLASLESSPLLERLQRRNIEVIFMTDPIDEYVTQQLSRYAGVSLTNVAKENLHLDDDEKEQESMLAADFVDVVDYVREIMGDRVVRVAITTRLTESPSALVSSNYGWTANMERLAKAQALSDKSSTKAFRSRRVLELNPFHPIVKELQDRIRVDIEDQTASDVAHLLYHSALLTSGFELDDPNGLSSHLQRLMMEALTIEDAPFDAELPPIQDDLAGDDEENLDFGDDDLL